MSQASKREWGNVVMRLALAPVLAIGGVAVAQTPSLPTPIAAVRRSDAAPPKASTDVETVRQLVKDGRAALQSGDRQKAEKLARQAAAMKVAMPFWEADTPEKLLIDIGVTATPPKAMAAGKAKGKADPKTLMRMATDAYKSGKLEEAQQLAMQANAPNAHWGLFEKSPSKLLDEIQEAKVKKNKEESTRVLFEARRQFEQGKMDDAEKLAYKAQNLHGPYSVWELGDRADKLIADIQTAKEKSKKSKPATPGAKPAGDLIAKTPKNAPPPSWPADPKKTTPAAVPAAVAGGVQTVAATKPASADMAAAKKLIAEGKACQNAGDYLEARAKYQEAQRHAVEYGADDERPRSVHDGPGRGRRAVLRRRVQGGGQARHHPGRDDPL